jgi:hypothetical protein
MSNEVVMYGYESDEALTIVAALQITDPTSRQRGRPVIKSCKCPEEISEEEQEKSVAAPRWGPGAAVVVNYSPVLSSERAPHIN